MTQTTEPEKIPENREDQRERLWTQLRNKPWEPKVCLFNALKDIEAKELETTDGIWKAAANLGCITAARQGDRGIHQPWRKGDIETFVSGWDPNTPPRETLAACVNWAELPPEIAARIQALPNGPARWGEELLRRRIQRGFLRAWTTRAGIARRWRTKTIALDPCGSYCEHRFAKRLGKPIALAWATRSAITFLS